MTRSSIRVAIGNCETNKFNSIHNVMVVLTFQSVGEILK